MDLKALRYFVAAVETGSITGAAERCFIAQPSITSAIKKLEEELDTQVLIRQKRGVTVTAEGAELYTQAKQLLRQASALENQFKNKKHPHKLLIGVSHSIAFRYLEVLLRQLRHASPGIQIKLIRGESHSEAPTDLRLTINQRIQDNEEFIPYWQDQYCLVTPKDHPLAFSSAISLSDIDGQPFILRSFCDRNHELADFLKQHNINIEYTAEVDNEEWALSLVAAGIGLAIIPLPKEKKFSEHYHIVPFGDIKGLQNIERSVGVAIRYEQYQHDYIQKLVHFLKNTE